MKKIILSNKIILFTAMVAAFIAFFAGYSSAAPAGTMGRPDREAIKARVTPLFVQNQAAAKLNAAKNQAPAQPNRDLLGDQRSFFVYNFAYNRYDSVTCTLRKVGGHCYVYVYDYLWTANLITQLQIDSIASTFDNSFYPTETAYFGQENSPGIDNDVRITILITRIYSAGNPIIGYFDPTDELPDSQAQTIGLRSNQREMFYMNGYDYIPANPTFMHTLAHEFWHMISYNQNPTEETWLEEGMADNAAYLTGNRMLQDKIDAFQKNPGIGLLSFSYENNALAHYGASFLFIRYLFEQYGGATEIERQNFMRNMTRSGDKGTRTVDFALAAAGYPDVKFKDVFADWALTNFINPKGYAKYKYKDFAVVIDPLQTHTGYPVRERSFSLEYWGANYILFKYAAAKSHVLEFSGAPYGTFYPRVCIFYKDGSIVVKNIVLNGDNKGFFDLGEFGVNYNSVLFVPAFTGERGSTVFRYAAGFAGPKIGIYPNPIFNDDIYITVKSVGKPEVIVKRSGGADQKVTMNAAQKNLYTGTYHIVYSGVFEVAVTGEDENGMSGTIKTSFEIRKLQNRVLNMIAFDNGRGYFAARADWGEGPASAGEARQPSLMVVPAGAAEAPESRGSTPGELKYLSGVRTFDNIPKAAYKNAEVNFSFKDIIPSNVSFAQLGIYAADGSSPSGYRLCPSRLRDDGTLGASGVETSGEYFLMFDDVPPRIIEYRRGADYIDLKVEDSGSGVAAGGIKTSAAGVSGSVKYFENEGILRIAAAGGDAEGMAVTVTDNAGNSAEYRVNYQAGSVAADISSLYSSPNPASSFANITWQGGSAPYRIKVYDIYSNSVFTVDNINGRNYRWNLLNSSCESVANGIYYFSVEDANNLKARHGKIAVLR